MSGLITVITGPMFSGKSVELARRLNRESFGKRKTILFRPDTDTRGPKKALVTHDGDFKFKDTPIYQISDFEELLKYISVQTGVVGVDEVQFMSDNMEGLDRNGFDVVRGFRDLTLPGRYTPFGLDVIVCGFSSDFLNRPVTLMPRLLCEADEIVKLSAKCHVCGSDAYKTQRMLNGKPVLEGPLFVVGDEVAECGREYYEARCNDCYEVPSKNSR